MIFQDYVESVELLAPDMKHYFSHMRSLDLKIQSKSNTTEREREREGERERERESEEMVSRRQKECFVTLKQMFTFVASLVL